MKFNEKKIILKDGTSCTLRSPKLEDIENMKNYLLQMAGETEFMARYPEEVEVDNGILEVRIENVLKSKEAMNISAFIQGELVGNVGIHGMNAHLKTKHRINLGISIKKKYWGIGLGSILMGEAIIEAKKLGYTQIELGVVSINEKAINLYKKYGFEIWGQMKDAFKFKDGTYSDEILMGRKL